MSEQASQRRCLGPGETPLELPANAEHHPMFLSNVLTQKRIGPLLASFGSDEPLRMTAAAGMLQPGSMLLRVNKTRVFSKSDADWHVALARPFQNCGANTETPRAAVGRVAQRRP